jgi:hypothetical protein
MAKERTAQSSKTPEVLELILEKPDDPTPVKVQVGYDPTIPKIRTKQGVLEPKLLFRIAMEKVLTEEEAARCPLMANMSKEDALAIIGEAASVKAGWLLFY